MHQPAELERTTPRVVTRRPVASDERAAFEQRARRLAWGANAWHVAEFAIAIAAGISAGSIALIGFGIDSLIEVLAGGMIVWLFTGRFSFVWPLLTIVHVSFCVPKSFGTVTVKMPY